MASCSDSVFLGLGVFWERDPIERATLNEFPLIHSIQNRKSQGESNACSSLPPAQHGKILAPVPSLNISSPSRLLGKGKAENHTAQSPFLHKTKGKNNKIGWYSPSHDVRTAPAHSNCPIPIHGYKGAGAASQSHVSPLGSVKKTNHSSLLLSSTSFSLLWDDTTPPPPKQGSLLLFCF